MAASAALALPTRAAEPVVSPPPALSTSGDYATDVLGDPWDFSNDEDVPPIPFVGAEPASAQIRRDAAAGHLIVTGPTGTIIKLVRTWGAEIPWGRDGLVKPIDAAVYNRVTLSMCTGGVDMAITWYNEFGQQGWISIFPQPCETRTYDLTDASIYNNPAARAPWAGKIVRFELLIGGRGGTVDLDWVRLHRAEAPATPPTNVPIPRILTPNAEGGADYATDTGNPWDFRGPNDIGSLGTGQLRYSFDGDGMFGQTTGNDPWIDLPLPVDFNPDKYHRATVDVCYGGGMSFADAPGGGMNARFAWLRRGAPRYTETQDIIIYPGCNRMTFEMLTDPPSAINDENSVLKEGWRGQTFDHLRFDLNEDPGVRDFRLREIKFADDAAFSTTYPITFVDAAAVPGTTVDIWVTSSPDSWGGSQIAANRPVTGGLNTFVWDGNDVNGARIANGTYWVWMTMRSGANVGSAQSSGPVRIERAVPSVPSYFVPLNPARLLDTRNGTGGNAIPLGPGVTLELDVTGVGGVPDAGVTAVVMNLAVANATAEGFVTAWPSGEARPLVASLNFLAGQIVPNLVTVKVGANGKVNLFNLAGNTDLVADVMGYYTDTAPASGGRFNAVTPSRVLDTRFGAGTNGLTTPIGHQSAITVPVVNVAGVPADASAVVLNLTVDGPTQAGYLQVWPTGEPQPFTATHNFVPGLTVGNLVVAKVGQGGRISIFNSHGNTHAIADVTGYFSASGSLFVPTAPRRVVDTRFGVGLRQGPVPGGETVSFVLANGDPIPPNATAGVMNVISANSSAPSFVTAWPTGEPRPNAATMNPRPGVAVPNHAYLKVGPGGQLSMFNFSGTTDLIVDVFGYFQ